MNSLPPKDTTVMATQVQFEVLRKIGAEGRAQMVFELSDMLRTITEEGIRQRHPDYTDRTVHLAALRLAIGDRLFMQAYADVNIRP